MKLQSRMKLSALIMSMPAIIFFGLFVYYPIVSTLSLGFTQFDLMNLKAHFVGLNQFRKLIADSEFRDAIRNTLLYTGSTVSIGIVLAFMIGVVITGLGKLGNIYSFIYFIPVISPIVAVSIVWWWIYEPKIGILNYLLSFVGIPPRSWLMSTELALPSVIVVGIWHRLGFNILLFVAGLKNIPRMYYDAAKIDGATKSQLIRYITLPLLAPITLFVTVTTVIYSFQVFAYIYTMTQGGPADSTRTVVYTIYTSAFRFFDFGYASAMAAILFIITMGFTILQFKVGRGGEAI